jgi:hypothetical protein
MKLERQNKPHIFGTFRAPLAASGLLALGRNDPDGIFWIFQSSPPQGSDAPSPSRCLEVRDCQGRGESMVGEIK